MLLPRVGVKAVMELDQVVELVERQILLRQAQVIQGQVLEVEVQVPLGQQLQLESEEMAVTVK